ncbi:MFS transporter [Thermodesulfobacteriota bacterium]
MNNKNKLILPVLLSSATLTVMAGAILTPVQNLIRDGLGIDAVHAGPIITTHGLFVALSSLYMGSLIDKKGVRAPYISGLFLFGLAGGSGLFITSYWVLLTSRAIMGIALASIFTCINVIILNAYDSKKRDRIMGWRGSFQSLGGIIWPPLGGFLGDISWHLPFAIYLISIPIGIAAYTSIQEPVSQGRKAFNPQENISIFSILKANPVIYIIFGLMFFSNFQLYAVVVYIPQLLELFNVSSSLKISSFITTMALGAALISFIYGNIRGRFSYRTISKAGVIIWTIVFFTISKARSQLAIMASVFFLGAGQGLIMPTVMAWIGDVVPVSFRGRFSSYQGIFGYMGQFLSPILLAPALIYLGIRGVFSVSASIGIIWFIILVSLGKNRNSI